MVITTLTDEEEKEFHRLSRFYWREALRCEGAKAYLAGCVMLGSALETLLVLMVNGFPDEAEQTGKTPTRRGKPKPLINWDLGELLRVAKVAQWLPAGLDLNTEWNNRKLALETMPRLFAWCGILHTRRVTPQIITEAVSRKNICNDSLMSCFSAETGCWHGTTNLSYNA